MSHRLTKSLGSLAAAAALLATPALAAPPTNGWCHLTPWVAESPAQLEFYGWRVELEDDWAFVTNRGDDTVDVFHRDGATWSKTQVLTSPTGPWDEFGTDIELDGDDLYVGAPFANDYAGAVIRFSLADGTWSYSQTISSPWASPSDRFGQALDVDDGWMAVGVPKASSNGAIDVLREVGGAWVAHTRLQHPDPVILGNMVTIRGTADGLYANVFASDTNSYGYTGAVFHFRVHPFGYQIGPAIQAPVPHSDDAYGCDIDFDGEHLVVGAAWEEQLGVTTGSAYVYDVDGEVFPPQVALAETLHPEAGASGAEFGRWVAVDGGRIAIASPHAYSNEVAQPGAVYVYRPEIFGNGWQLEDRLSREGGQDSDLLGWSVALDGGYVLSGAWNAGGNAIGEAVLFSLTSKSMEGGLAPSDVLATVEAYGAGKAGSLGVPVLTTGQPPVPGESSLVALSNVPQGTTPVIFVGFEPAEIPFDGGALLVNDPIALTLPTVTILQQVGMNWMIPDDAALAGVEVFAQAMLVDPAGFGAKKTAQSRGMKVTIGY
ncbi:MAG: hypothetical protein H6825_01565 [Planctomycetes bacterium]|nr:hypothetical protein [Planctomycetota bacterium]